MEQQHERRRNAELSPCPCWYLGTRFNKYQVCYQALPVST